MSSAQAGEPLAGGGDAPGPRRRKGVAQRVLAAFFPFSELGEDAAGEREWNPLGGQRRWGLMPLFMGMALFWLLAVSLLVYVVLTTSALGGTQAPAIGCHLQLVCIAKRLVEFFLMRHMCCHCVERLPHMKQERYLELEHAEPGGLLSSVLTLFGRPRKWFSTFLADNILLFGAGLSGLVSQLVFAVLKMHLVTSGETETPDQPENLSGPLTVVLCALNMWMSINVMGWIFVTLDLHMVPKKGRGKEFTAAGVAFVLMWAANFFIVSMDRKVLMSPWILLGDARGAMDARLGPLSVSGVARALVSGEMLFITHSLVMLGAILLGHSAHLRKCPELTWRVMFTRMAPALGVVGLMLFWLMRFRYSHLHASCRASAFGTWAVSFMYMYNTVILCGAVVLLGFALWDPPGSLQDHGQGEAARGEEDEDSLNLVSIFDYDSVLILITFGLSVFYNVSQVFEKEWLMTTEGVHLPFAVALLRLLCPLGAAAFAARVWARPPKASSPRGITVWFALIYAALVFLLFQHKEDCEISSPQPGCCMFPGLLQDVGERALQCDQERRCAVWHNHHGWCGEPAEHHLAAAEPPPRIDFNATFCQEMSERWAAFMEPEEGGVSRAQEEVEEEEEGLSTAFRVFTIVGQAASIEMYFTIIGVLLKVLFLTQHPNSELVVALPSHHHHVHHHTGENAVVTVGAPSAAQRWGAVRGAVGVMNLRARSGEPPPHNTSQELVAQ